MIKIPLGLNLFNCYPRKFFCVRVGCFWMSWKWNFCVQNATAYHTYSLCTISLVKSNISPVKVTFNFYSGLVIKLKYLWSRIKKMQFWNFHVEGKKIGKGGIWGVQGQLLDFVMGDPYVAWIAFYVGYFVIALKAPLLPHDLAWFWNYVVDHVDHKPWLDLMSMVLFTLEHLKVCKLHFVPKLFQFMKVKCHDTTCSIKYVPLQFCCVQHWGFSISFLFKKTFFSVNMFYRKCLKASILHKKKCKGCSVSWCVSVFNQMLFHHNLNKLAYKSLHFCQD